MLALRSALLRKGKVSVRLIPCRERLYIPHSLPLCLCKCTVHVQRLSSAPIPFTVLSIAGSTCNEDYLAVCGLKVLMLAVILHCAIDILYMDGYALFTMRMIGW